MQNDGGSKLPRGIDGGYKWDSFFLLCAKAHAYSFLSFFSFLFFSSLSLLFFLLVFFVYVPLLSSRFCYVFFSSSLFSFLFLSLSFCFFCLSFVFVFSPPLYGLSLDFIKPDNTIRSPNNMKWTLRIVTVVMETHRGGARLLFFFLVWSAEKDEQCLLRQHCLIP